jgi:mitotic spindle assembly checkpoint protein MAD2
MRSKSGTDEKLKSRNARDDKSDKDIQTEIAAILRQITACVSFLPILGDNLTFNVLAYTSLDSPIPNQWVI